jgi:hypothetical protein
LLGVTQQSYLTSLSPGLLICKLTLACQGSSRIANSIRSLWVQNWSIITIPITTVRKLETHSTLWQQCTSAVCVCACVYLFRVLILWWCIHGSALESKVPGTGESGHRALSWRI